MADRALSDAIRLIVAEAIEIGDAKAYHDAALMLRGIRQYRTLTHGPEDVGLRLLAQDILRLERLATDPDTLVRFRAAHATAAATATAKEDTPHGHPHRV